MLKTLSLSCIAALALATLGCVDRPLTGDTAGTTVYVYDNVSKSVKVWNDAETLYVAATPATAAAIPDPDRAISGTILNNVGTLAWGGMALDTTTNKLYLVSASGGKVTRIERVASQSGELTLNSDIVNFTLGTSTDRYSGGSFGQAAILAGSDTLYVTETNVDRSATRIWVVAEASKIGKGNVVPVSSVLVNPWVNDFGASGVAVGQGGQVFGYFPDGDDVTDLGKNNYDGGRIRAGRGYFANSMVLGTGTQLSDATTTYGSLAYDSNNNTVYVARQSASADLKAVLVFTPGQILGAVLNPEPRTLEETADKLPNLRFITHAGRKDWLAGADMVDGKGSNRLHLWKTPSAGGAAATALLGSLQVGGIALAGSN